MSSVRRTAAALVLSCAGFSTAETAAVVAATSVLTATAAPQIEEYLQSARAVKANGDVRVIAMSVVRLWAHVGQIRLDNTVRPKLLVSEGEIPDAADVVSQGWTMAQDNRDTQSLAAHLVDNEAGYAIDSRNSQRWRGPYLDRLSADPWGSRYAVNIGAAQGGTYTVFVLSAGPNRVVETPYQTIGVRTEGDDVIGLIGRGH